MQFIENVMTNLSVSLQSLLISYNVLCSLFHMKSYDPTWRNRETGCEELCDTELRDSGSSASSRFQHSVGS